MITFLELHKLGRLGNQMFQIASTIGIAKKNNEPYAFPEWEYRRCFTKELPELSTDTIRLHKFKVQNEANHCYTEYWLGLYHDWSLHGFFQSEKYFAHCKEEVLSYFEFTDHLKARAKERMMIASGNDVSKRVVAIHVRRGDYVGKEESFARLGWEYYCKAIDYLLIKYDLNVSFMVFSDEPDSAYKQLCGCLDGRSDINISVCHDQDFQDICTMSMCDDIITANSSFSWWGAYLMKNTDKVVIQPKAWFGPFLAKDHDAKDMYFENAVIL